jgi:hypothetical protein
MGRRLATAHWLLHMADEGEDEDEDEDEDDDEDEDEDEVEGDDRDEEEAGDVDAVEDGDATPGASKGVMTCSLCPNKVLFTEQQAEEHLKSIVSALTTSSHSFRLRGRASRDESIRRGTARR